MNGSGRGSKGQKGEGVRGKVTYEGRGRENGVGVRVSVACVKGVVGSMECGTGIGSGKSKSISEGARGVGRGCE